MTEPKGKMTALAILILVMLFLGFVMTPLVLAPLGVFTGLAHGVKAITVDTWHLRPWFPFFPIWSFSLFFFILWIAVVVWVYKDAERRGMNGGLWALLVFFGNVIGLLIFLIVRQDHPEQALGRPTPATTQTAKPPSLLCPSCQKPVEKSFAYCPGCGATLQQVCRSCGKPVEAAWKVCPHCGAKLQKE